MNITTTAYLLNTKPTLYAPQSYPPSLRFGEGGRIDQATTSLKNGRTQTWQISKQVILFGIILFLSPIACLTVKNIAKHKDLADVAKKAGYITVDAGSAGIKEAQDYLGSVSETASDLSNTATSAVGGLTSGDGEEAREKPAAVDKPANPTDPKASKAGETKFLGVPLTIDMSKVPILGNKFTATPLPQEQKPAPATKVKSAQGAPNTKVYDTDFRPSTKDIGTLLPKNAIAARAWENKTTGNREWVSKWTNLATGVEYTLKAYPIDGGRIMYMVPLNKADMLPANQQATVRNIVMPKNLLRPGELPAFVANNRITCNPDETPHSEKLTNGDTAWFCKSDSGSKDKKGKKGKPEEP